MSGWFVSKNTKLSYFAEKLIQYILIVCQLQRCCLRDLLFAAVNRLISWHVCDVHCCRPLLLNCPVTIPACRDEWTLYLTVLSFDALKQSSSSHPGAAPPSQRAQPQCGFTRAMLRPSAGLAGLPCSANSVV